MSARIQNDAVDATAIKAGQAFWSGVNGDKAVVSVSVVWGAEEACITFKSTQEIANFEDSICDALRVARRTLRDFIEAPPINDGPF